MAGIGPIPGGLCWKDLSSRYVKESSGQSGAGGDWSNIAPLLQEDRVILGVHFKAVRSV